MNIKQGLFQFQKKIKQVEKIVLNNDFDDIYISTDVISIRINFDSCNRLDIDFRNNCICLFLMVDDKPHFIDEYKYDSLYFQDLVGKGKQYYNNRRMV